MKKLIFFLFFAICASSNYSKEKVKLYLFYTPSHEQLLLDWFLPSLKDDFELVIEKHIQECPSGKFMYEGWTKCMLRKIDLIIRGIKENWDKVFIHADIDIQFFKPFGHLIPQLMEGYDLVIQRDDPRGNVCAGFFICRGNVKTLELWQAIRDKIVNDPLKHDQELLNELLKNHELNIVWNYLPITFFGGGILTGKKWKPGFPLEVPHDIILHHANWTRGVDFKIAQLCLVKDVINNTENSFNG